MKALIAFIHAHRK